MKEILVDGKAIASVSDGSVIAIREDRRGIAEKVELCPKCASEAKSIGNLGLFACDSPFCPIVLFKGAA